MSFDGNLRPLGDQFSPEAQAIAEQAVEGYSRFFGLLGADGDMSQYRGTDSHLLRLLIVNVAAESYTLGFEAGLVHDDLQVDLGEGADNGNGNIG